EFGVFGVLGVFGVWPPRPVVFGVLGVFGVFGVFPPPPGVFGVLGVFGVFGVLCRWWGRGGGGLLTECTTASWCVAGAASALATPTVPARSAAAQEAPAMRATRFRAVNMGNLAISR
ncbi:hypothetical protein ACFU5B_29320, partial [Streptomyces murinus]|uniref:hypothetical protein n=2 Tax=Actinomycetota TaxID=201174 RepID=UPI003630BE6D